MDKIGLYQILEVLHSGQRPLYKVKASDGRILAVKAIAVAGLSEEMRERFTREAEICRTLDHPNLVRVYDAGEANGMLYQVMDLLEGSDFSKVLSESRKFTWSEKLSIMEQVCDGLQYAHDRKMVHRDVKPANLFLESSGRVRVLDFGMARLAESELTKVGSTLGTLNYMCPEQIRGMRCTAASDVFSAGIVFYQLATGKHPFSSRDRSLAQVVSAIVFETPPKISDVCPDAPEGFEFILNKALDKEPERRPQNAGDLRQELSLCRITLELSSVAPRSAAQPSATKEAPPAVPVDEEKTRVMRRLDVRITNVPEAPDVPVVPPPAVVPAPHIPQPSVSRFRYCPSCTFANPLTAVECIGCGLPLVSSGAELNPDAPKPWTLYIAVSVALLLAVALAVALIVKR